VEITTRRYLAARGVWELRLADGTRLWVLPEAAVALQGTLEAGQLELLREESVYLQARDYAVRALGRRELFTRELADRLRARQVPPAIAARLLAELQEKGYLDDERAARGFVRARLARYLTGPRKLTAELRRHGIAREAARRVVEECTPPGYEEKALAKFVQRCGETCRRRLKEELGQALADASRTESRGGPAAVEFRVRAKHLARIRARLVNAGFSGEAAARAGRRILFGE